MGEATQLSPLAAARARRRLSVDEAAARAGLDREALVALEQGRLYRFGDAHDAIRAALVYAGTLGIDRHEARRLAGLPVPPRLLEGRPVARAIAAVAFGIVVAVLAWSLVTRLATEEAPPAAGLEPASAADGGANPRGTPVALPVAPPAPAPLADRASIRVDVQNGSQRRGAAASLAERLAGLSYSVGDVSPARRRDFPFTRVYYSPGGEAIAARLAAELGVATAALPGRIGADRLVVIVGARDTADTSGRP